MLNKALISKYITVNWSLLTLGEKFTRAVFYAFARGKYILKLVATEVTQCFVQCEDFTPN